MSQIDLQIGYKIKTKRRKLGISQTDMSKKLSISASYLNLIESGKRKINVDLLLKLADELAVDLDIKTKSPSPVMLPKAVASFTPLLFNLTMLMIYSIHTF